MTNTPPTPPTTPNPMTAGWYRDPTGVAEGRYWDGSSWTESINSGGVTLNAPVDAATAHIPPVPGTEFLARPVAATTRSQPPEPGRSTGGSGAALGAIAIVAILAILAAVFIFGGSDDDDPVPTDVPTTQVVPEPDPQPEPDGTPVDTEG